MTHPAPQMPLAGMIVTFLLLGVVLFFRLRRMSKERPLKPEQLWIVPAIYLMVVAWLFYRGAPNSTGWMICAGSFALGGALGWQRGRMMHIIVDRESGTLNQKASIGGMLFIVGLIVVKVLAQTEGAQFHLDLNLLTQAFGSFGLGLFTLQRVEMYLRAKRLLEDARPV